VKHRLLVCDAVAAQPWRNGGGVTRELLAWPEPDDWQFRISVAEICRDGAFSLYPGVERWFAVLDGEGVALRIDGSEYRQQPHDAALRFAGEAQVHCQLLGGPTRDLNLMLRHASGAPVERRTRPFDGFECLACHLPAGHDAPHVPDVPDEAWQ